MIRGQPQIWALELALAELVRHTPRDDLEEIVDGLRGEAEATEEDGRPAAERDKILDAIEAIRQARARVDAHGETL